MAVTLDYVTLSEFSDVMSEDEQAEATDDGFVSEGTLRSGTPTREDEMVKRFLKRAENLAENYVGTRYSLPLSQPSPMFKYTIYLLARYMLDERGDGDVTEAVMRSYNMAIDWLEDVRDELTDIQGNTEDIQEYYGSREGGTFGSDDDYPFNDKSTAFTGEPFPA